MRTWITVLFAFVSSTAQARFLSAQAACEILLLTNTTQDMDYVSPETAEAYREFRSFRWDILGERRNDEWRDDWPKPFFVKTSVSDVAELADVGKLIRSLERDYEQNCGTTVLCTGKVTEGTTPILEYLHQVHTLVENRGARDHAELKHQMKLFGIFPLAGAALAFTGLGFPGYHLEAIGLATALLPGWHAYRTVHHFRDELSPALIRIQKVAVEFNQVDWVYMHAERGMSSRGSAETVDLVAYTVVKEGRRVPHLVSFMRRRAPNAEGN